MELWLLVSILVNEICPAVMVISDRLVGFYICQTWLDLLKPGSWHIFGLYVIITVGRC